MSRWKETIEQRIRDLEETISSMSGNNQGLVPAPVQQLPTFQHPRRLDRDVSEEVDQQPPQTWRVAVDTEAGPNPAPASYVSVVPTSAPSPASSMSRSKPEADFITRGLITIDAAETLFKLYRERLDHFLYSIIGDHKTLQSVRQTSTTLISAICAVSALHSQTVDYHICHREFRRRVSHQFFSRQHSLDEVRGLCIGAFWLSDMSWALVGAAVRIAIEINLHRCFHNPDFYSREWYTQARVYLLVYVCDHHFSVIYGRPPMTRELDVSQARSLLSSQHAGEDDYRLFSQVEIWAHNYRTYKTFGIDNDALLLESCLSGFRRLSIALDTWRADWEERFRFDEHVGNYPVKGVALHYHFAKLYLCSYAFRNFSTDPPVSIATRSGVEEYASMGVNSAIAVLRGIVVDEEVQTYLNGLPTYFDTMIAFAVVFLLKLVSKAERSSHIDKGGILLLLDEISVTLETVTATMRPQHLLSGISASIKKLITKASQPSTAQSAPVPFPSMDHSLPQIQLDDSSAWTLSPDDTLFLSNFDFASTAPDLDFNFMDFSSFPSPKHYPR